MRRRSRIAIYIILVSVGIIMIYPLLWLFFSTFKDNSEIFGSLGLLPNRFSFDSYIDGWTGAGRFNFGHFILNSFRLVIPTVLGTVVSSLLVAYGFARFSFPLKRILFVIMISTMMLPNAVLIIPRFLMFNRFGWLDTYLPFYMPQLLAFSAFFNFLLIQFLNGIPNELDESAVIDGCGPLGVLVRILIPLCKPAIMSVIIFQFLWTWNDFFNSLIYINSVSKYTVALALRMALDVESASAWNRIFALSFIGILPPILLFFSMQKYFVEGITTSGLKG